MSEHPNENHQAVRRIVLPSGRTIEVVRYGDAGSDLRQLHVCSNCTSDLVQPLSWTEAAEGRWEMSLECPNCGWSEAGTFTRQQVEQLEDRLDEGLADMIADLQRLTQANMTSDVERFVSALDTGLILPEDF